jgi:hypothetical protein
MASEFVQSLPYSTFSKQQRYHYMRVYAMPNYTYNNKAPSPFLTDEQLQVLACPTRRLPPSPPISSYWSIPFRSLSLPPKSGLTSNNVNAPSIPPVARRFPSVSSYATRFRLRENMLRAPARDLVGSLADGTLVSTVRSHTSRKPATSTRAKMPGFLLNSTIIST